MRAFFGGGFLAGRDSVPAGAIDTRAEGTRRRKKAPITVSVIGAKLAGWTGLEPATSCVTGRRSNQLSYHPVKGKERRP